MKLGIIRCMQTEDYCPGTADFKAARLHMGAFAQVEEEIEIVGFTSCGGCPGKKAVLRARELVKRGADAIAFASCIQKELPSAIPVLFIRKCRSWWKRKWERMCASWNILTDNKRARRICGALFCLLYLYIRKRSFSSGIPEVRPEPGRYPPGKCRCL